MMEKKQIFNLPANDDELQGRASRHAFRQPVGHWVARSDKQSLDTIHKSNDGTFIFQR